MFELMTRALDGELSPVERGELDRLLATSDEARQMWDELRTLRSAVAGSRVSRFEVGFADRVMAAVDLEKQTASEPVADRMPARPARMRLLRWPAMAAAAAVALLMAVGLGWWGTAGDAEPSMSAFTARSTDGSAAVLPDGSTVELAPGATLTPTSDFAEVRTVRLTGEAYFDVAHDASRPFVVETFNADVTVLGTTFGVRAWPDEAETTVALETGRVEFAAETGRRLELVPGNVARANGSDIALIDRSVEARLAWRTGGLDLVDVPLPLVAAELERRYEHTITLDVPNAEATRFTYIGPAPASIEDLLTAISRSHGLRYRKTADGYVLVSASE